MDPAADRTAARTMDRAGDAPDPADPRRPDWPIPDLQRAADAHWDDAARLRLLARDLGPRPEPDARWLLDRVIARLAELPPPEAPRARVIRREPMPGRSRALPETPTPEMATLLDALARERASGESARAEAAALRRQLEGPAPDDALRHELEAARAEARAARDEARRLAERLAFVSASPRGGPTPAARPDARPADGRSAPDPAYAELGLSPDLPDELLPVLERALLRHHHPDRADAPSREAATRRFQSVTLAFQRIRRLRGLA